MPAPRRLGKYEIRDTLGKGAMGTVYRGFDPYIERLVAIKTINKEIVEPDLIAHFMARFRNEAKAAGRLHHPNIVGIYEYGEDDAVAFIAMEYVEGTNLREYVHGRAGFDFRQVVALMAQLLRALEFAHGAGVVHRDIKPSNLIVTRDGVLKVADFGVARVDRTNLTATGMIVGTPSYMSPEQCRGKEADARSDLFSAGVVLYELLTGDKPFRGPVEAIAYKICHEEPEAPSKCSALQLPAAIDQLVATALAKDPAQRFASARAFHHALREMAQGNAALDDDSDATRAPAAMGISPPHALAVAPNNLPQQLTSFVGRERALAEVKQLLRSARLLTLLGAGGLGKTRLALQVGSDTLDRYPDGVWLVELAPLSDARLVPQAVASALGVIEEAGHPLLDALVKHVADRALLLILDNCEHLLHACAELARRLLQAGPRVQVLTTSREPLHIVGETSYPVLPLAVPDPQQRTSTEALSRYEAVRLFVDRAVATQHAFQLTDRNAAAVADICHRLDGIPLALELAAARVRALSVEAIAQRLGDRFRLLKGGDQTALPRQQTLRSMIDWSYDLLTPDERTLLRRLSVFAGGWTLEGAETVGAGGEIDAADVLDLLSRLVEKSLVVPEAEGTRYRLLETVRQYAQERLQESGEQDATRTRHLRHFVALAEEADPKLLSPEQRAWHARLDLERENLLAAHAWCDHAQDGAQLGLRLVHALRMWLSRGRLELGYRVTVEALAREGAQERNLALCQGLFSAGVLDYYMGRYDDALKYGEASLAIAREIADPMKVADALALVGVACLGQGDRVAARRYMAEGVALTRELGDKLRLAQALIGLGELNAAEGKPDEAEPLYQEALTLNRELGDLDATAATLYNLARIAIGGGAADRAGEMLRAAVAIGEETGWRREAHQLLSISAALAAHRGEWERAARFHGAAAAQLEQRGLRREPADEAFLAPLMARTQAAIGAPAFVAAEAAGRALDSGEAVADARAWLCDPSLSAG